MKLAVVALGALMVFAACSSGASTALPSAAAASQTPVPATASVGASAPVASPAISPSASVGSASASPTASPTAPTASPTAPATTAPAAPSAPPITPNPTATAAASTATPVPTPNATAPPAIATSWRRVDVSGGPSAREDQTWTVDGDGRYAYLFGGRAGATAFDDLWRYDLAADTWKKLSAGTGPSARFGHTATWVPGVGLVVFSGQVGRDFFSDIWAYAPDAGTWTELASAGSVPEPRYGSCAGLAPDGRLWISHGFTDQGRFFDTRTYDFGARRWTNITRESPVPVIRCLHDCIWTPDGRFVLYGGQTNGVAALGDLWARPENGDWQAQSDPPLAARQLYAVATVGNTAFIFGGGDTTGAPLRDLWTLDLVDFTWKQANLGGSWPSARLSATLISDPARSRLLLFGGKSSQATYDDVWEVRLGS